MASADIAAAPVHSGKARVNKHKADWRGWKFMWPFAVVFVFVFIVPIVYAVYISFFKKQMIGGTKFVGFENYARCWVMASSGAVLVVWPCSRACRCDHAVPVGFDGPGVGFDEAAWHEVLPYLDVPALRGAGGGVDVDLGFRVWREVRPGGFVERFPGYGHRRARPQRVVGQYREHRDVGVTGYNMLIFYSSLSTIPHSLYEAASIDGASEWQIVKSIKLPELRGSLAITVIFSIIARSSCSTSRAFCRTWFLVMRSRRITRRTCTRTT